MQTPHLTQPRNVRLFRGTGAHIKVRDRLLRYSHSDPDLSAIYLVSRDGRLLASSRERAADATSRWLTGPAFNQALRLALTSGVPTIGRPVLEGQPDTWIIPLCLPTRYNGCSRRNHRKSLRQPERDFRTPK
ncbi:MAG TPA: PDC sensor domain-containing protein [Burkholderiales bacterium]|nr:PDC sensor domain-containing protein [Burkholderiales bacterium]